MTRKSDEKGSNDLMFRKRGNEKGSNDLTIRKRDEKGSSDLMIRERGDEKGSSDVIRKSGDEKVVCRWQLQGLPKHCKSFDILHSLFPKTKVIH
jgi:hypothetical protein